MRLGWKVLVPVSLVWVLAVAAIKTARAHMSTRDLVITIAVVGVLGILASGFWPGKSEDATGDTDDALALGGIDTTGTFPIPRLEDLLAERAPSPVAVGALSAESGAVPAVPALTEGDIPAAGAELEGENRRSHQCRPNRPLGCPARNQPPRICDNLSRLL